jgi:hypothetical protein
MSSASDHHAQADELLNQAHAEQDSIRRGLILAEAQVHATLALSAPARTSLPGPGRGEAGDTRRAGQVHPLDAPADPGLTRPQAHGGTLPGWRKGGPESSPGSPPGERGARGRSTSEPRTPYTPGDEVPARPGGQPLTFPGQQVPDPAGQPADPGGPSDEEPGRPGDQEPRGPGAPEPGGLTPLPPVT